MKKTILVLALAFTFTAIAYAQEKLSPHLKLQR